MSPMKVKALLFDMDGTLLDTEAIYTEVANELLAQHGLGPLPWSVKVKLQGLPGVAAAQEFLNNFPQLKYTAQEWMDKSHALQQSKWTKCQFLPGAKQILEWAHSEGLPIALATSSLRNNYEHKTAHHRAQFDYFGEHVVTGDDERIPAGRGKPHPDIWQVALKTLNDERASKGLELIKPEECLVFEDAVPGLHSAVAFGAGQVVWIPDPHVVALYDQAELKNLVGNNLKLDSLADFETKDYTFVK